MLIYRCIISIYMQFQSCLDFEFNLLSLITNKVEHLFSHIYWPCGFLPGEIASFCLLSIFLLGCFNVGFPPK